MLLVYTLSSPVQNALIHTHTHTVCVWSFSPSMRPYFIHWGKLAEHRVIQGDDGLPPERIRTASSRDVQRMDSY